jgi:hypothetical protein
MKTGTRSLLAASGIALVLAGCAKEQPPPPAPAPTTTRQESPPPTTGKASKKKTRTAAAATPKIDRVQQGMRATEVQELMGRPDAEKTYITGKQFIPWYFGPDTTRTTWFYKGQGRVTFKGGNVFGSGGSGVMQIEIDPNEAGVAR